MSSQHDAHVYAWARWRAWNGVCPCKTKYDWAAMRRMDHVEHVRTWFQWRLDSGLTVDY